MKEHGSEKEGLSAQIVTQPVHSAYFTVNSHPVGKISKKAEGTARALYMQARPEAEGSGQGRRQCWAKKQLVDSRGNIGTTTRVCVSQESTQPSQGTDQDAQGIRIK